MDELEKLRVFYREVALLTQKHDVINDVAVVTANKLDKVLEKVNPDWYKIK